MGRQVGGQVGRRADDPEGSPGPGREPVCAGGQVKDAGQEPAPQDGDLVGLTEAWGVFCTDEPPRGDL